MATSSKLLQANTCRVAGVRNEVKLVVREMHKVRVYIGRYKVVRGCQDRVLVEFEYEIICYI